MSSVGRLKLTREQRDEFFARSAAGRGSWPRLVYPGDKPCPVVVGMTHHLGPKFWIEITEIVRNAKGEHVLKYTVWDHRLQPHLLKRTPSISEGAFGRIRRSFDAFGYPQEPTPEVLAQAAEESAYGSSQHGAVDDSGEGPEREVLEEFANEAKLNLAQKQALAQARREQNELVARLARAREDAKVRGVDISSPERVIERQLVKIERRVYEGKRAA